MSDKDQQQAAAVEAAAAALPLQPTREQVQAALNGVRDAVRAFKRETGASPGAFKRMQRV